MTAAQYDYAAERIVALRPGADVWRSGCARGLDSLAARFAAAEEGVELELFVPAASHNEALVRELEPLARVIRCPQAKTSALAYRVRNEAMISGLPLQDIPWADRLHAFVTEEDFYRSGEWMTINIARRVGVEIVKDVLPRGSVRR
jgi:hypothetical protein